MYSVKCIDSLIKPFLHKAGLIWMYDTRYVIFQPFSQSFGKNVINSIQKRYRPPTFYFLIDFAFLFQKSYNCPSLG